MNDTIVTVVGNVVAEPTLRLTAGGVPVLSVRVASTPRRFDTASGEWRDRETTFLSVTCWRSLAEHVSRSVHRGDPVVVHGRLVQSSYETALGERRTSTDIEAITMGHDLSRGAAAFARTGRTGRSESASGPTTPAGERGPARGPHAAPQGTAVGVAVAAAGPAGSAAPDDLGGLDDVSGLDPGWLHHQTGLDDEAGLAGDLGDHPVVPVLEPADAG